MAPAFGLSPVRIELHTVQPGNAAGKGAGNGEGRYVQIIKTFKFCRKIVTIIFKYVILIARYCVSHILAIERRSMVTITKGDLITLGYGPSFAADIIRETKKLMISKGHTYYQSRKLDRVPKEAVEELLGITIPDKQN